MEGGAEPVPDEWEGKVHFPLEGGVPKVQTAEEEVGPGVVKQVMRRGRSSRRPKTTSKCFGSC